MKAFIAALLVTVAAATVAEADSLRDLARTNGTFTPHGVFDGR